MVTLVMEAILDGIIGLSTKAHIYAYQSSMNVPIMKTLSVIEYELSNITVTSLSDPRSEDEAEEQHPLLYQTSHGMSSRMAYLGAAIAFMDIKVVLFQFKLVVVDRRQYRSPTQLLVVALEEAL